MSARCSEACGWCGRCTAAWEKPEPPLRDEHCGYCGMPFSAGGVTVAGLGVFCSRAHADAERTYVTYGRRHSQKVS